MMMEGLNGEEIVVMGEGMNDGGIKWGGCEGIRERSQAVKERVGGNGSQKGCEMVKGWKVLKEKRGGCKGGRDGGGGAKI